MRRSMLGIAGSLLPGLQPTARWCAERLLRQNTWQGKILLALGGSSGRMLRRGRIDEHRRFTMADGEEIDTWLIRPRSEPVRGTAVLLHGLMDCKMRFLGAGRRLAARGFHVVLPDLRAHGRSTGRYVTYGALERWDVKSIIDQLMAEGAVAEPLYVMGASMGGGTAVHYAAIEPRVRGVLAVCPLGDIRTWLRRSLPFIRKGLREETLRTAGELAGFDTADLSAIEAARRIECPLIVAHGRLDILVPLSHGRGICEAAGGPSKLIIVPWAGHTSILLFRNRWFARKIEQLARSRTR